MNSLDGFKHDTTSLTAINKDDSEDDTGRAGEKRKRDDDEDVSNEEKAKSK